MANQNAFLFSLVNGDNTPLKMACINSGKAVHGCGTNYTQIYGSPAGKRDLLINDNSNTNTQSYSDLGIDYKHPR